MGVSKNGVPARQFSICGLDAQGRVTSLIERPRSLADPCEPVEQCEIRRIYIHLVTHYGT